MKTIFLSYGVFSFIVFFSDFQLKSFNYKVVIFGAFLYIAAFIYECFYQLKNENFTFFRSNDFLLIFSPVFFFFGLSIVFGFESERLARTIIFYKVGLYEFIIHFVNVVYYSVINTYFYKEKKLKNAS